jgi:hypothetical protein
MSDLIDLTKKVEVVLDLRKISTDTKAQVCYALDGSGSMTSLYNNGTVQRVMDRISAIAVKFDDNQELDVMVFSNGVTEAESATPEMFGSYVKTELLNKGKVPFGGTNFAPFINKVVENYFSPSILAGVTSVLGALKGVFGFGSKPAAPTTGGKSTSGYPIFCIVMTDGENSDPDESRKLLSAMQDKDIYWQFVGIGHENFRFLKKIADELPNVGFFEIKDIETVKDMDLYKSLVNEEFAAWIKKF